MRTDRSEDNEKADDLREARFERRTDGGGRGSPQWRTGNVSETDGGGETMDRVGSTARDSDWSAEPSKKKGPILDLANKILTTREPKTVTRTYQQPAVTVSTRGASSYQQPAVAGSSEPSRDSQHASPHNRGVDASAGKTDWSSNTRAAVAGASDGSTLATQPAVVGAHAAFFIVF